MNKGIVKLRCTNKIAKKNGIYVRPYMIDKNNYATGQGVLPNDASTHNNLTLKEMIGEVALSEEKAKRFPFIVDPFGPKKFEDGFTFDLDTPEGEAMYNLVLLNCAHVAIDKVTYQNDHMRYQAYFENRAVESTNRTKLVKDTIKAGSLINSLSLPALFDLANFLYIHKNESNCSPKASQEVIIDALYAYSQKKPKVIIDALKEDNVKALRVSNFIVKGILTRKNSDFYEGNTFLANSFEKVVALYNNNFEYSQRWDEKYSTKSENAHASFAEVTPTLNIEAIKNKLLISIMDKDITSIDSVVNEIKASGSNELMVFLVSYNSKINEAKAPVAKKVTDETAMKVEDDGIKEIISESNTVKIPAANTVTEEVIDVLSPSEKAVDLINLSDTAPFMKFKSDFLKSYPEYDGEQTKVQIVEFLKTK